MNLFKAHLFIQVRLFLFNRQCCHPEFISGSKQHPPPHSVRHLPTGRTFLSISLSSSRTRSGISLIREAPNTSPLEGSLRRLAEEGCLFLKNHKPGFNHTTLILPFNKERKLLSYIINWLNVPLLAKQRRLSFSMSSSRTPIRDLLLLSGIHDIQFLHSTGAPFRMTGKSKASTYAVLRRHRPAAGRKKKVLPACHPEE